MMNTKNAANLVVLLVLLAVAYFGNCARLVSARTARKCTTGGTRWVSASTAGRSETIFSGHPDTMTGAKKPDDSAESYDHTASDSDEILQAAFENHRRNVEVVGVGRVARVLPDDEEGIEHQKFILRLASGQELLVAHNTDLARRIPALKNGDTVEFRGEYEWNPQGGVLHWTHRDPQARHADGWLKRNGQLYQ